MKYKNFEIKDWQCYLLGFLIVLACVVIPHAYALEVNTITGENYIQLNISDIDLTYDLYKNNELIYNDAAYETVIFNNLSPNTPYLIDITDNSETYLQIIRTKEPYTDISYSVLLGISILLFTIAVFGHTPIFKLGSFVIGLLALIRLLTQTTEVFYLFGIGIYLAGIIYSFNEEYKAYKG